MTTRRAAAAALALTLAATGAAHAAPKAKPKPKPKPLCNLVTDPSGDTFALRYQDSYHTQGAPYGPQEDGLDLLGADFGSDAKSFTAVVRVKNLSAAVGTAPGGVEFDVNFTSPKAELPLYLRAVYPANAAPFYEFGSRESYVVTSLATKIADATGFVDKAKNEVHITVPVAAFKTVGGLAAGTKLAFGEVTSGRYAGGRAVFADVVVGEKTYPAGAYSCVTPGK